jgi:sugar phosphate isomerase/epimerase
VDGEHDSHTLPYLGIINWKEVMEALGDIGYTGDITFEAHEFFANRPKELIASCAQHMAQTGKVLANMTGLY